jgi:hypothetical protein
VGEPPGDVLVPQHVQQGQVGAAKALHLLAPGFLPLWDRAIAVAYGLQLGYTGTNGKRYVRMANIAKSQSARVGGADAIGADILKALDEYNYCRFTKGWTLRLEAARNARFVLLPTA